MEFIEETKNAFPNLKYIFEIGAHRGIDIPDIINAWPEAIIHAFEADPYNYKICEEKFKDFKNVYVHNIAVTDHTGTATFNRYYDVESIPDSETMNGQNFQFTGQGSILKPGNGMKNIFKVNNTFETFQVNTISLFDFCSINNICSIDAIFMDVQGAEFNVFEGCKNLLNSLKATIFEWSTNYIMYEDETDFNFIKFYLENYGMKEVIRKYQFENISGDSLFLRLE